jgi:hypothetical protein
MFQRYYAVSLGLNSITGTSKITYLKQHWVLGGMRWHRLACPFCVVTTSQGIRGLFNNLIAHEKVLAREAHAISPPSGRARSVCLHGRREVVLVLWVFRYD